jgi:hypothetical protein
MRADPRLLARACATVGPFRVEFAAALPRVRRVRQGGSVDQVGRERFGNATNKRPA